ncbi:MAG: hypothetical protein JWN10_2476, partial [Solirubrobacterales bacterium]|nr:hypothetical protein [Solirubrobacterales bacterium]
LFGAAFDGRYLYFVPNYNNTVQDGLVTRYDTQGAFGSVGAWSTFDLATVNASAIGFLGAAFDGRYVYFVPGTGSLAARYDTQRAFGGGGAWTTFDVKSVNAGAPKYFGAAFDGRYVYLVPGTGSIAARFDAKTPPSVPPAPSGSFF